MFKIVPLMFVVLAAGQSAFAQPPAPVVGAPLQQIPPTPSQPRTLPEIRLERGRPPPSPEQAGVRIVAKSLRVTGQTKFTEAELIAAAQFKPGAELSLADLRAMAQRITDFYSRHGYFVAQAYLPAQDIPDGVVTIAVVEGRYGQIKLDNRSRVSDRLAHDLLAGLNTGDVVETGPLERRLLLLSDLPGVDVRSTLSPGAAVGTSDLAVDVEPGQRINGSLEADNAGNPYTGEWRGGGTVDFNEPFGIGDVASLRLLTSGSGLAYVRAAYQAHIQAATAGVAYVHLGYTLGGRYSPLAPYGVADIASVFGDYPLVRSRATNLAVHLGFDARYFRDEVSAPPASSVRDAQVGLVALSGDHQDRILAGGWTSYLIEGSFGSLHIETAEVRAIDAVTAQTGGGYGKLWADVTRVQELGGPFSLYGEARGQLASKNLDPTEKMELGGAYGVRAFPEGEAYGDQGYILTAEARARIDALTQPTGGQVQVAGFFDNGAVSLNRSPWVAAPNHRTLSAAGAWVRWAESHGWVVKATYAFRVGDQRALSAPDHGGHFWFQLLKFF